MHQRKSLKWFDNLLFTAMFSTRLSPISVCQLLDFYQNRKTILLSEYLIKLLTFFLALKAYAKKKTTKSFLFFLQKKLKFLKYSPENLLWFRRCCFSNVWRATHCSNLLWEKIVLVWGKKLRKKFANSRAVRPRICNVFEILFSLH